ncbi:MAG: tetratricopeptide repeat protein [Acidobacteria bacterium]|nr:tetratricopeptide repeat protein [Acidobacteriota bacterium]
MTRIIKSGLFAALLTTLLSFAASAQAVKRTPFDVTNYVMDVALSPTDHVLKATVDVTFTPLEDTRSVAFELNGSLKVDTITRLDKPVAASPTTGSKTSKPAAPVSTPAGVTFVQDQTNSSDLGPSVRIDLGDNVTKGTTVTLRFKYSGALLTPEGGPLTSKRLAAVDTDHGYLMYAARWFPFHNYAADDATSDITITLPAGYQVVGYSDSPVTTSGGKYRFVSTTASLPGNFAWGKFTPKPMHLGDWELDFYAKPGDDQTIANYGETLGKALQYYTTRWGTPASGKKLSVIEIDDESLDFYSAKGMLFVGERPFEEARDVTTDRLEREGAFQWWGLTVGLKAFDDAWLSQGLAEYSAFAFRESQFDASKRDQLQRELLEKSLTFEQTASVLRAPATLDDQSAAYQYIMYGKGAFAFELLRTTMGQQKFDTLLRNFLAQYRGKNASIDDFEKLASQVQGEPMRYFFARWVESTGVPEFSVDYQILRTRGGKFVTRGTVKQNYENLRLPVDVQLVSEGEQGLKTVSIPMDEATADFNIESDGKPIKVNIDPGYKLLRISPDLRVSSIARRGIEQFKEGNYAEAQQQFEAALKLDRSNSWIYYHLGLLFLDQRNYDMAIDNFKASLSGNLNPTWLAVWSNIKMGNAYDAKGDRARAVAAYKRADALGDDYDSARNAIKKYMDTPYDPKEKQTVASNQ